MREVDIHAVAADRWEVVVIGAGPAGSVCAHALARLGRRVLLVDRSLMPRPKVCGCCIAPAGVDALELSGLGAAFAGAMRIDMCELRVSHRAVTLPAQGFRVLGRDVLDSRLAAAAEAVGATLLTGWHARVQPDGGVRLRRCASRAAEQHEEIGASECVLVRPLAIVVADGIGGAALADRVEFGWSVSARSRMGLGAMLTRSPVPLASGRMAMLCGRAGYLGLVRLPTGEIDAAAAIDPAAIRDAGGPAEACARIVAGVGGDVDAIAGAAWRGTPLLTRRRASVEAGSVYVVGDAAGYVEPFTGEGMTWAIRGSLLAAEIITKRIDRCDVARAWEAAHSREIASHHRRCAIVARLVRNEPILRAAVAVGAWAPRVLDRAASLLGPIRPQMHEGRRA